MTNTDMPIFELRTDQTLTHVEVTEAQMLKALQSLKVDKSPGPDGLHPRVLKEVASEIAYPLTVLSQVHKMLLDIDFSAISFSSL